MSNSISELGKDDLLTIKEASEWASGHIDQDVTRSNISYLIQYGKVKKYSSNGDTLISKGELKSYYESYYGKRETDWKKKHGEDLNWALSFDNLKERDTTKHVHRLHPYKGKFIPQLVEYFIDDHTDDFKEQVFFESGDTILDPFCGSGTTLVQSNELGINSIGIDISKFNATISNAKIADYDLVKLKRITDEITNKLNKFSAESHIPEFQSDLKEAMREFNDEHFPSPDYRYQVSNDEIDEKKYGAKKEKEFLSIYEELVDKYDVALEQNSHKESDSFLDKWYIANTRKEIDYVHNLIDEIEEENLSRILKIILSRTIRSCRATTHSDLATLKEPQLTTYYCRKHKKICKPLFSIRRKWKRYAKDTLKRFGKFKELRTNTFQHCFTGDSTNFDIFDAVKNIDEKFGDKLEKQKIDGIFTSPPYVGVIDYHEQHAYAYDLFDLERKDEKEIGPSFRGRSKKAREQYKVGISEVLLNSKKYLKQDYNVFLVANDKDNLYPEIAERTGMKIVNKFKRPVLNRTERGQATYSEIIFHLKDKQSS